MIKIDRINKANIFNSKLEFVFLDKDIAIMNVTNNLLFRVWSIDKGKLLIYDDPSCNSIELINPIEIEYMQFISRINTILNNKDKDIVNIYFIGRS